MIRPERETNQAYYGHPDVVREYASLDFLLDAERSVLAELGPDLPRFRMLDLGVGGGRTTVHFAERVKEYVGLDPSAAMIEACARRFNDLLGPRVSFVVGDARDLSAFAANSFDLVLFAAKGLDSLGHEDRIRALREIHRTLAPGGIFVFSTDNLLWVRKTISVWRSVYKMIATRRLAVVRHPGLLARAVLRAMYLRRVNGPLRAEQAAYTYLRRRRELSRQGYADPDRLIAIDGYAIEPRAQVAQLAAAGFEGVRVLADAEEVTTEDPDRLELYYWLYYRCHKGREERSVPPE